MKYLRKTEAGILVPHEDGRKYPRTPKEVGCCGLHWLPAGEHCDEHVRDTGPGILMNSCTNCWHYNDRSLKYKRIGK